MAEMYFSLRNLLSVYPLAYDDELGANVSLLTV